MRWRALPGSVIVLALLVWPSTAGAHAGHGLPGVEPDLKGAVRLKSIGRFHHPTSVIGHPTEPAVLVTEKDGRIRAVSNGIRRRPFLDIRGQVAHPHERGLLSIAFSPDYATSGLFYVFYTNRVGNNIVAEFKRGPSDLQADPASQRILLQIPHFFAKGHNAGQLQFGPDGLLYIASGDGGGVGDPGNDAQNPNSLLGKILRIDPQPSASMPYTIPPGNPFAGGGGAPEVYSLGLRNPWRFSFDLVTNPADPRIIIGDVGLERFEEIDYETIAGARGANFGWNDFEGFAKYRGADPPPPSRHDEPIKVYRNTPRACAVIGGYVGRNPDLGPVFGRYLFGDFCNGKLRTLVPDLSGTRKVRTLGVTAPALTSFGQAPDGTLYAASLDGPVYKLKGRKGRKR